MPAAAKKREKKIGSHKKCAKCIFIPHFVLYLFLYFIVFIFRHGCQLGRTKQLANCFPLCLIFVFPVLLLFLEQVKQIAQSLSEINQIKMQPEPQILRNQQANTSRTEFANEIENESKLKTYRGCVYFFGV